MGLLTKRSGLLVLEESNNNNPGLHPLAADKTLSEKAKRDAAMSATLKWTSLILMTFQNAITPLVFRYATTETTAENRFSTAIAVMMAELIKFILSAFLIFGEEGYSLGGFLGTLNKEVLQKPVDTLKLAVPATLYFIQNQCLQVASANLPAAVFQVMYQGKTLVVAICSVVILQKELTRARWAAIGMMGSGLAIVQLAKAEEKSQSSMANAAEQSLMTGLAMVLIGCLCSGFAGVYFEKMMKKPSSSAGPGGAPAKPPSMWVRNLQLAFFTIVIGTVQMMGTHAMKSAEEAAAAKPVLHGFTSKVWVMVVNNALGGLCVAFVIKYADNILKGFCCAIATVIATIASVPLFGFTLGPSFAVGMLVVLASTLVYGGTVKIPRNADYWYTEPETCKNMRRPTDYVKVATEAEGGEKA